MELLRKAARNAVKDSLNVQKGERVLVVCDEPLRRVGYLLWEAARDIGAEAMIMEIVPRSNHGEEPPQAVEQAMCAADVVIAPTSASLTHTKARRKANAAGARVATLPDISEEIMARTLNANYQAIQQETIKLWERLKNGNTARVTSPSGTDIKMGIQGRLWHLDTGIYYQAGEYGNLPAGECYIAPLEGTACGQIVIDGSLAGFGLVDSPVMVVVKDGLAVEINGGEAATWLRNKMEIAGPAGRNIGELGIGTNDKAQISGKLLEDEKVKGTVHIAFGNNASFGGSVEVSLHIDGIIMNPSLQIDGIEIIQNGSHIYSKE